MIYVKRGIGILTFLLGLAGLLLVSSFVFVPKNNTEECGMEEVSANGILGEKENTIDVLIVGDSESYASISPMQLWRDAGYTAYVTGTSAQTLDYSLQMVKRAFLTQTPKIVILETNAVYRDVSDAKAMISYLGEYFSIFQYHNRWKHIRWDDFKEDVNYTWTNDFKGYRHSKAVKSCEKKDYMKETSETADIPAGNIEYVKEIKKLCDEHGAKLLLLRTPSTLNWNYAKHNGMKKMAEELGCEQIDMNLMDEEVQIDWETDTRDKGDHLNDYGAEKVTRVLTEYLKETKLLCDHREDAAFRGWNEALKRYTDVTGL